MIKVKKKVLIIGPIGDFGGQEIEARNIIDALSINYNVKLLSTAPMTETSVAVYGMDCQHTCIHRELENSNLLLKVFSFLAKKKSNSSLPSYFLVSNKVSNRFFNFRDRGLQILKNEIDAMHIVLFCGTLESGFLKEVISYCFETQNALVLRTTGKIDFIAEDIKELLTKITAILVHSNLNARNLKEIALSNIVVVDQTSLKESELLALPIDKPKNIIFGFIGRFSEEKGIIELLKAFSGIDAELVVAGGGNLIDEVQRLLSEKVTYLGEIESNNIANFYNKIDVLIIPSHEEAGPLVGIEAMAAGKIIFSTQVGAMMERLSDTENDFWFDINTEQSLLKLIKRVRNLSPEEIKRIRESNREVYLRYYSIEMISNRYLNIFGELI